MQWILIDIIKLGNRKSSINLNNIGQPRQNNDNEQNISFINHHYDFIHNSSC